MPCDTNEFQRAFAGIFGYVKVMNVPNKLGHHIHAQSCAMDKIQQCWFPFALLQPTLHLANGILAGKSIKLNLFEAILYGSKKDKSY